jgi:hypothetical protein
MGIRRVLKISDERNGPADSGNLMEGNRGELEAHELPSRNPQ